jgi:hypothetical protein
MTKSPIPDRITTIVWEYLRRNFRIDATKATKKDINRLLSNREAMLRHIKQRKRTMMGISPKQAKNELRKMRAFGMTEQYRKQSKGLWSKKVGVYSQMKKDINTIEQKSGSGKSYTRTYQRWEPEKTKLGYESPKETLRKNINLPTGEAKKVLEGKYQRGFTYMSVAVMKSRLKKGM